MNYCGLDLGKKYTHFHVVDAQGQTVEKGRCRTRVGAFEYWLRKHRPLTIGMEACLNAFWLADRLEEHDFVVKVTDPGRTKAVGYGKIKNDRLDAQVLATLTRADMLCEVDRPTETQRHQRMQLTTRAQLVKTRTQFIQTVTSLMTSEGIEMPATTPNNFTQKIREHRPKVPAAMWSAFAPLLPAIDTINVQIYELDDVLAHMAGQSKVAQLLQTMVGIGPQTSIAFELEVRDPERFESGRKVGAYIGLVPSVHGTGGRNRLGRITKRGSARLRQLLCLAANSMMRSKTKCALKAWALRLAKTIGRKKATIALARKMSGILWAMWRDERPFDPWPAGARQQEAAA